MSHVRDLWGGGSPVGDLWWIGSHVGDLWWGGFEGIRGTGYDEATVKRMGFCEELEITESVVITEA